MLIVCWDPEALRELEWSIDWSDPEWLTIAARYREQLFRDLREAGFSVRFAEGRESAFSGWWKKKWAFRFGPVASDELLTEEEIKRVWEIIADVEQKIFPHSSGSGREKIYCCRACRDGYRPSDRLRPIDPPKVREVLAMYPEYCRECALEVGLGIIPRVLGGKDIGRRGGPVDDVSPWQEKAIREMEDRQ